jgi:hypothetical protein
MRTAVGTFLGYMLGTAVPIILGVAGLQVIMTYGAPATNGTDSVLAQRIETARAIRAALAKPIPPPPPLPPITAKLAHPLETKTASRETKPKVKRIPQEAWDSYAQGERSASSYSYPAYGGSGGW